MQVKHGSTRLLYVHSSIKDKLLKLIVGEIHKQFGTDVKNSPDYPRVVNNASLNRLKEYLNDGDIYYGEILIIESCIWSQQL